MYKSIYYSPDDFPSHGFRMRSDDDLSVDQMVAWAEAMGIESVVIDENTDIRILKNELRWNEVVYR